MRAVIYDITGFRWQQDSIHASLAHCSIILNPNLSLPMHILELRVELAHHSVSARDLMKVGTDTAHVTLVHDLPNHAVDVQTGRK